jgi:ecotin
MKRLWIGILLFSVGVAAMAAEHAELKAFPAAEEGMVRFVIVLPHKERGDDQNYKVELTAGKEILTDGANVYAMGCRIEPRPLTGWGYTFYEVTGSDRTMSTRMAPPPGTPKAKRFVSGEALQIPYNSRLPVVIYAPRGFEVRYRIWEAPGTFIPVEEG